MPTDLSPRNAGSWWPYLLIAALYTITSPYHQGLNNPNEMVRVYMSKAWVDTGRFVIDPVIREWGMVDDKAVRDGELYSSKAPLQSLVGIPAYAIAPALLKTLGSPVNKRTLTWVLRLLASATFGIGFAWVLLAWCQRRAIEVHAPAAAGTGLGLALALGTMLYPYALTFTGHGMAALCAGGCYLAVVEISRAVPGDRRWVAFALAAGCLGGAAPFSEYPSALVAGPALLAAVALSPGHRGPLLGWLALGGAAPFGLGLWAHGRLWGHPFRTGYGFLENKSYVQVHGEGFFGVSYPKTDALVGSLFSPGTGLFFYSPFLVVGLIAIIAAIVRTPRSDGSERTDRRSTPLPRALAGAALVGFLASLYFISSHRGWRGGWTVGPRYIIAVAPLLGLWAVEALRWPRWRPIILGLAALSIVTTGFAAALYPHLSDVYTNPLATFLWPSYWAGEMAYGLGHSIGLRGFWANLPHVGLVTSAVVFCLFAARRMQTPAAERRISLPGHPAWTLAPFTLGLMIIAIIPENDTAAARRENRRLWGFWEPAVHGDGPDNARRLARPGRVFRARTAYREIQVHAVGPRSTRPCLPARARPCRYGDEPWQRFGPEILTMNGVQEDVLFLHPIAHHTVRASVPVRANARTVVLRYGLADASVHADNPFPVEVTLRQGDTTLATTRFDPEVGLHSIERTLTGTQALSLELWVERDGARVFGFDLEQYK